MKLAVAALLVLMPVAAFAGDNTSVSQAYSASQSSVNQQDRAQAPGFGVGGGYCSDAASLSVPGGGFGFSTMSKVCKDEKLLGLADKYFGRTAARQIGCENVKEFRTLPHCINARNAKAAQIQKRDRAKYRP